jgi:hypothetical protein
VSRTPAAELARVKITHPAWAITRTRDGYRATRPGRSVSSPGLGDLEHALHALDTTGPRRRGSQS